MLKNVLVVFMFLGTFALGAQTHITDRAGLEAIANDLTGSYILDNDIDLSGADWVPLGSFSGTLDGNGHKILNMTINVTDHGEVGFFTKIDYGGDNSMTVKNLGFVNANVTCSQQNVGIIAGKTGPAKFENCWVESGIVHAGNWGVGSLVGNAYGINISKCYSYAYVYGEAGHAGGLVGDLNGGKIEDSNYWGKVTGSGGAPGIGGIVGWVHDTTWSPLKENNINRCYAKGIVEGVNGGWAATGIVGIDDVDDSNSPLTVTDCIAAQSSITPVGRRILNNFKSSQYVKVVNSYGTTSGNWQDVGADKQDGADMTEEQFKDQSFYDNNLPNWIFSGGFDTPVWNMTSDGPLLVNQHTLPEDISTKNSAQFISQSISNEIVAGESFTYEVTFKNTGTETWTSGSYYRLGAQAPHDNTIWLGTNRIGLPHDVAPGEVVTFSATLTAPADEGIYVIQWRMVQEGVGWFGDRSEIIPFINYTDPNTIFTYTLPTFGNIYDEAMAASCLQGLINRDAPIVYVLEGNGKHRPLHWLNIMTSDGRWLSGRPQIKLNCIEELFALAKYKNKVNGAVIWDPDVSASMNVATTIAGVEDLVVFSPEYADENLNAWGLQVTKDLRGMFTGSQTGSAKNDAYRWAINEYLSKGLCSDHFLNLYEDPYLTRDVGDIGYVVTRDWSVMNRSFVFDLSPWGDEVPLDDEGQPLGTDLETYKMILQEVLDQTAGEKTTELAGFFSFKKYSNVDGHPSNHDPIPTEWETVSLITPYNCYQNTIASSCYNQSFHSHAVVGDLKQNRPADTLSLEEGKTYVCLLMGDYDSATPLYDFLVDFWSDSQRGALPLLWGINPNLVESYPDIISYYYETKTGNDYFAPDASAAGYMNPNLVKEEYLPLFVNHNKKFYNKLDMTMSPMVLDWDKPTSAVKDAYSQFSPDGYATIVSDYHNNNGITVPIEPEVWNGMPVTNLVSVLGQITDIDAAADALSDAMTQQPSGTTSFYLFRMIWSWPNQVADVINTLKNDRTDLDIKVVDPYNFFKLFKDVYAPSAIYDNELNGEVNCLLYDNSNALSVKTTHKVKQVDIYSIDGRVLKTAVSNFNSINISDLKSGNMYLIKVFLDKGIAVKKIIK